jgi:hypothetical protein
MHTQTNTHKHIHTTNIQIHTQDRICALQLARARDLAARQETEDPDPSQHPLELLVYTIYAAMPHEQQLRAFEAAPEGSRKVILATNIAETSITISGVRTYTNRHTHHTHIHIYTDTHTHITHTFTLTQAVAWQKKH